MENFPYTRKQVFKKKKLDGYYFSDTFHRLGFFVFKLWAELGSITQIITYNFTILICLKKQVRNPKQFQAKVLQ